MVLNNLSQSLAIWFEPNFFYPIVQETWLPVLKRSGSPYMCIEDFMNGCIQSLDFPGLNAGEKTQQIGLFKVGKRPGYTAEQLMEKTFTLTIKLSESYVSYFIMRQQIEEFLSMADVKNLYMAPLTISLLDDFGFETMAYQYNQLTMTNISNISLSYAARLGQFNTFTVQYHYNYFDIYYRNENGTRELLSSTADAQYETTENLLNKINNEKSIAENAIGISVLK
jgi:hypothetical protein